VDTSRQAVEAARDSAESSRRSADEAAAVARIEADREHHRLGPTQTTVPTSFNEPHAAGHRDLFGTIILARDYRVRAFIELGPNGRSEASLPAAVLRANEPYRIFIEKWPPGQTKPEASAVLLKLWPPVETDAVEHWTCRCGRPLVDSRRDDPGHWDVRLPLEDPTGPIVMQGSLIA